MLEPDTLTEPIERCSVIVHAATAIPTDDNPSRKQWAYNDRVRLEGMKNVLKAAEGHDVRRILFPSVVWVARQDDGGPIDESSPSNPDRTTRAALETEQLLEETATERGLEHCVLRLGMFYGHDAAHTRQMGQKLLEGKLPIVGSGWLGRRDATLSYLHVDDAASAVAEAAESTETGLYHVVDDRPATFASFLNLFADRLGAPTPRRIPAWLARWFIGPDSVRLITTDMPTNNQAFRDAFGWEPGYPSYEEGLEQVVERWLEDGTIVRKEEPRED